MKLVVGLGNPGKEYEKTRHNAGFLAIDELRTELDGAKWKLEKKFKADISAVAGKEKILLIKPQTFMNLSGQSTREAMKFYKIKPADVWVIHDEMDLPLGAMRIKIGGRSAGHNGIQSVIDSIGSDFVRFRIGIGIKNNLAPTEAFVLQKFSSPEMKTLTHIFEKITEAILMGIEKGLPKAMSQFN